MAVAKATILAFPAQPSLENTHLLDFLNYKTVERGLSENTRESYRYCLSEFCSFLGAEKMPTQATRQDVDQYISLCYERNRKPSTIAHHISALREFFKFLQMDRMIQRNPTAHTRLPKKGRRLPKGLSESEVYELLRPVLPTPIRRREHEESASLLLFAIRPSWKHCMRAAYESPNCARRS